MDPRRHRPRGKIIPIFDLAARMGLEPSEPGKIVIVSSGAGQVGVMVDEVEEVLTVSEEQLEDVPTANSESIEASSSRPARSRDRGGRQGARLARPPQIPSSVWEVIRQRLDG